MKVVVVTGGIGSGKSIACDYLNNKYGWPVYQADLRVKQLYATHPTLLSEIESALGVRLRSDNGMFNPSALSAIIFHDPESLAVVESLVFPVLSEDFDNWKNSCSHSRFVVLESATILQKPQLCGIGDITLLVDAPIDIRLSRACSRDGVNEEMIRQRMANQQMMNSISTGLINVHVDSVVINDGTVNELQKKLDEFVKIIA